MAQTRVRIIICFSLILIFTAAVTLLVFFLSRNIWLTVAVAVGMGFAVVIATSGLPAKGEGDTARLEALRKGELEAAGEAGAYIRQLIDDACTVMDAVATGDLSVANRHDDYKGDYLRLGDALDNMLAALNSSMADISSSISSAYTYSKCISETSVQLAENASDQSVAIANLGQSMGVVADRAMHTTGLARGMADASAHIHRMAAAGMRQMDGLLHNAHDISSASKALENVLRTMDDIAFRTNILALNAATEAAAAGQQNRGIAMIADEVRQLAAVSAQAAQQSKQLLTDNITRADDGYNMAMHTRASLQQVLTGVQDVSNSITMINRGSEAQAQEIAAVNTLLEQQARAVSQCSSASDTAAEYGRGMEECAGQLGQLAQRFLLDEEHSRKVKDSRKQLVAIRPAGLAEGESVYKHLIWDNSLSMGNETIDGQHKQLIALVDDMLQSCFNGTATSEINKAMGFVLDYTVQHFADEEKLQLKYGYPEYRRHKQIHNAFKQKVQVLAKMLEENGPTTEMVGIINKELVDWLLNHIKVEDKKISKYLRS